MAVITVSRECGSGGEGIAKKVAQRLGYDYLDNEILAEVAQTANTTQAQIRQYDEKEEHGLRSFLKKLSIPDISWWAALPYYYPPGVPMDASLYPDKNAPIPETKPIPSADDVLMFIRDVVEKLWKRGNVVIVGRGGQKILATKSNTLHLRFVGAIGDRKKRLTADEDIALKKMQDIDKLRARYLKHHYGTDWNSTDLYHLVLNTSLMSGEQAVNTVIAAIEHMKTTKESQVGEGNSS